MRVRLIGMAAFACLAAAASAVVPAAQAEYEAGEAALAAGRFDDAAANFGALEARLAAMPKASRRTLSLARLGLASVEAGRGDDSRAIALATRALPGLARPADAPLRRDALVLLARAEERSLDLPAATLHFREAVALTPPAETAMRLGLTAGAIRNTMFDDPTAAAREAAELVKAAEQPLARDKEQLAQYWLLLARARLNAGDAAGAHLAIKEALKLAGGLTERISPTDAAVRSDAVIIATRLGRHDEARRYLLYTGAGLMGMGADLTFPAELDPPPCGDGLLPDDRAIVEFSLGADGAVSRVRPIWASRPGPVAVAFARAVKGWSWPPDAAAAIKPFFRAAPRVELRCTTAPASRPTEALQRELHAWLAGLGETVHDNPAGARLATLRQALAAEEARSGAASVKLAPSLIALARHPQVNQQETFELLDRAATLARGDAPAEVRAVLEVRAALFKPARSARAAVAATRARLEALVADAAIPPRRARAPMWR